MNKKAIIGALGMYSFLAMSSKIESSWEAPEPRKPDRRIERNPIRPVRFVPSKGMRKFEINGKEIWAINEKNAIRKAGKP